MIDSGYNERDLINLAFHWKATRLPDYRTTSMAVGLSGLVLELGFGPLAAIASARDDAAHGFIQLYANITCFDYSSVKFY